MVVCVGCQILSIFPHCSMSLSLCHHISFTPHPPTKSHITDPPPFFTHLPRRHRWCICTHRLQASSFWVADLSFYSVQPARHPGWRRDRHRKPSLTEQRRSSCRNTHQFAPLIPTSSFMFTLCAWQPFYKLTTQKKDLVVGRAPS